MRQRSEAEEALVDLRRSRRRNRLADLDVLDALYQAYLTAIGVGTVILVLSDVTGDGRLGPAQADEVRAAGPATVGLLVAVVVAVGLRSGGRGGPLALEAAEVRHVLLAPVSRSAALRGPVLRLLRTVAFAGVLTGAVVGLLAARRLPGWPPSWILLGALTAVLAATAATGAAMAVAGRRWSSRLTSVLAVGVVLWAAADVGRARLRPDAATAPVPLSPFTLLGRLALWPLGVDLSAVAGVALALALVALGVALVAGTSLEASERRAALVSQLRFAATLQDLRTVVLLRRQLAQEQLRSTPWLRLGRYARLLPGAAVWHRDWRGTLRWPAVRLVRLVVLGLVCTAALFGVWAGTTPLIVVAGLASFVAALDALEPLAQELDHPDRLQSFPRDPGTVLVRHLAAPAVVLATAAVLAAAAPVAAARLAGAHEVVVPLAGLCLLPAVLAALAGAAVSVVMGPPGPDAGGDGAVLVPEAAGLRLVARLAWPPALATAGFLPVLAARYAQGLTPIPLRASLLVGAALAAVPVLLVVVVVVAWLRRRGGHALAA